MFLRRQVDLIFDSLLTVIYPQPCVLCGESVERRELGVACDDCWRATRLLSAATVCWKCGRPAGGTVDKTKCETVRCRRCDAECFSAARSCGIYEGALRASVLALKREAFVCRRLRDLLVESFYQSPIETSTVILPVPLHPQREKERGHNQARLIADELSKRVSLPINHSVLIRTRHTDNHRAGMDAVGRRRTVDNCFEVPYPSVVTGERVLLVDDVFTTGATVSSCGGALLQAGALDVFVLTLARVE